MKNWVKSVDSEIENTEVISLCNDMRHRNAYQMKHESEYNSGKSARNPLQNGLKCTLNLDEKNVKSVKKRKALNVLKSIKSAKKSTLGLFVCLVQKKNILGKIFGSITGLDILNIKNSLRNKITIVLVAVEKTLLNADFMSIMTMKLAKSEVCFALNVILVLDILNIRLNGLNRLFNI